MQKGSILIIMDEFTTDIGDSPSIMPVDEEVADVAPSKILDELRAELEKEVERPLIEIVVPERPNISLRFNPNITQSKLTSWRNNSGVKTKKGLNSVKFSTYVIGDTCVGIYIDGELAVNDDGVALTFGSEVIWEMSNSSDPVEAIKAMFGVEPHLEAVAIKIIEEAGYGEEVDAQDPFSKS